MSGIDLKYVRQTYEAMSDEELARTATQDAAGLTPEAMEIVKAEIMRRGMGAKLAESVDAQNKTFTLREIDAYCDTLSVLPCPNCGSSERRLNGTMTGEVMSFLIMTQYRKKFVVACPRCLDKANNAALAKSAILGWWGLPWGIINTIQSIILNSKNKNANHLTDHNNSLRSFVLSNAGAMEAYKNDPARLSELIGQNNRN